MFRRLHPLGILPNRRGPWVLATEAIVGWKPHAKRPGLPKIHRYPEGRSPKHETLSYLEIQKVCDREELRNIWADIQKNSKTTTPATLLLADIPMCSIHISFFPTNICIWYASTNMDSPFLCHGKSWQIQSIGPWSSRTRKTLGGSPGTSSHASSHFTPDAGFKYYQ